MPTPAKSQNFATITYKSTDASEPETFEVSSDLKKIRIDPAYRIAPAQGRPGKCDVQGYWWSSTMQAHYDFSSRVEREALMALDFEPQVSLIYQRSICISWPNSDRSTVPVGIRQHVPALLARMTSGDIRVVDLRVDDRSAADVTTPLSKTYEICTTVGWEYEVFTSLPHSKAKNISWLSGYRYSRHAPSKRVADNILSIFSYSPINLREGLRIGQCSMQFSQSQLLSHILHLLWMGKLNCLLEQPISMSTEITL